MGKLRLLCVDREKDICNLIARILESFEVIAAQSVRDAERLIAEKRFDLLVINSYLPDGCGLKLCRAVRKSDASTPILFVVGGFAIHESEVEKAGAQGCIYKGVKFVEDLENKVTELFSSDNSQMVFSS